MTADLRHWKNKTEANRRHQHQCKRCGVELVPGVDTTQFCRQHQDEQNASNRASYRRRKPAA